MTNGNDDVTANALEKLYERWTLDVLPALAPAAAAIFKGRPQRFKNIGPGVIDNLARFHYRTGYDETSLDTAQRTALLRPLLGESDGIAHDDTSEFHRAAHAVRLAAVDFVQRSEETGEAQLRAAFSDTVTAFERYLTSIRGAVVDNAISRTKPYFDAMVDVLRDGGFSGGFGLPPAPATGAWPIQLDLSGDGAALVEEIGQQASGFDVPLPKTADQHAFIVMQRVGHFGRLTIEGTLASGTRRTPQDTDALIDNAYRWWTALRNLRNAS